MVAGWWLDGGWIIGTCFMRNQYSNSLLRTKFRIGFGIDEYQHES
jgi:hypothetical protein